MKDGIMAQGQAPEPARDHARFAVVMGAVAGGVYLIIATAAHYLNVGAGPLPFMIDMLVVGLPIWKHNTGVKHRRPPEVHEG